MPVVVIVDAAHETPGPHPTTEEGDSMNLGFIITVANSRLQKWILSDSETWLWDLRKGRSLGCREGTEPEARSLFVKKYQ